MKTSSLGLWLFAGCLVIAACSQAPQASRIQYVPNVNVVPGGRISPMSYDLLYTFGAAPDGAQPFAGLIDVSGTFYGTTKHGGANGFGVFSFSASTGYNVLYPFGKGGLADAEKPFAGLIDVGGTLYGTTYNGGLYGYGALFSVTTSGVEKVLYSFGSGNDGRNPSAALTNVSGTLYGTTRVGGKYGGGTVFSITTSGTNEKVLHGFDYAKSDGYDPIGGLTNVGGTLYGTTYSGGTKCPNDGGCGTVFSVTTGSSSTETVLHNFSGGAVDGKQPSAGVANVSGALFGTTTGGGKYGNGTVFIIDLRASGRENLLHSFGLGGDGRHPTAALIYEAGNLIGTTMAGGSGYGTVFSLPAFRAVPRR